MISRENLPQGWVRARLGDVVESCREMVDPTSVSDVPYIGLEHIEKDRGTLIGRGSSNEVRSTKARFNAGDVLYGKLRPYLNKVCIPDFDGVCSTDLLVLRPLEGIPSRFLLYRLLNSDFVEFASSNVSGVQHPRVDFRTAASFPVLIPPLPEQHRIVAKIEELFSELDAGVAALETAKKQLARYRQSVLKAAVEGKLTAAWRKQHAKDIEPASELLKRILKERREKWEAEQLAQYEAKGRKPPKNWQAKYKEPEPPDTSDLPELPEGWVWTRISQLGDVQLGRQRSPKHHSGTHMRPYLRVANVFEDRIDTADVKEMNFTPSEFKTYKLAYGDILLNEGQSLELVGRPAMYRNEVEGACFQNTLVRFRTYDGLDPRLALLVFRAYFHTGRFQKIASWTTSIAHLGAGRFAELEFPLPPLAEQDVIVAEVERLLSVADEVEQTILAELRRADRLRQRILKKAFEGKLVPQDPADEPAAELLKRIREMKHIHGNGRGLRKQKTKGRAVLSLME